jgi:hypothetical protein
MTGATVDRSGVGRAPDTAAVLADLARVKATFQLRAIVAALAAHPTKQENERGS